MRPTRSMKASRSRSAKSGSGGRLLGSAVPPGIRRGEHLDGAVAQLLTAQRHQVRRPPCRRRASPEAAAGAPRRGPAALRAARACSAHQRVLQAPLLGRQLQPQLAGGHGGQQVVAPQQALGTGVVARVTARSRSPSSDRQRAASIRERWSAGTRRTASANTASARSNWRSSSRSSPSSRNDDSFIPLLRRTFGGLTLLHSLLIQRLELCLGLVLELGALGRIFRRSTGTSPPSPPGRGPAGYRPA